jgi:hypothetical protein
MKVNYDKVQAVYFAVRATQRDARWAVFVHMLRLVLSREEQRLLSARLSIESCGDLDD